MAGVIFVNPQSGSEGTSREELAELFPGHRVEECPPSELAGRVKNALGEGVGFVGVAGGDGTIRCAAEELQGRETPLLVIPAGTRNHFAKELGIGDFGQAQAAATGGSRKTIDLGSVNGRSFLNNSSVGLYPKLVLRREAREHRFSKGVATVVAIYEQLRHGRRLEVEMEGQRYSAWMVFVGNGPYGQGLWDLTDRASLDDNMLDVRLVRADRPLARLRLLIALALGRLARCGLVEQRLCRAVELGLDRPMVEVALDGEVERIATPLRYRSLSRALTVLVGPNA